MGLGIAVMTIIILIALLVVAAVLYYGAHHDSHTDIRSAESSRSVQMILEQDAKRAQRLEELARAQAHTQVEAGQTAEPTGDEKKPAAGRATGQGVEALNDEEARERRRQAALARKAARQQTQAEN